jgi:antitoxin component of RelBE/YafQ-DinJ toxin-antitoxin module
METQSTFTIRVPIELKKRFEAACEAIDITPSQLMRNWMRSYAQEFEERYNKEGEK